MIVERYFPSESEEVRDLFAEFKQITNYYDTYPNIYKFDLAEDSSNIRFGESFGEHIEFMLH